MNTWSKKINICSQCYISVNAILYCSFHKLIMKNLCDFVIRLSDMHKLSYTRKIGLMNFSEWETIKTCFHHKKLLGKSFEERNTKCCKVFKTHKNGRVSRSPIRKNKHWIYCLKAIKSEKFQDPPPPFCVGVINGWPRNSSWLWRAKHMKQQPHSSIQHSI